MNITALPDSALEQSVLVVAHPDDEILWFGSIVQDVGHIVICFLDDPNLPEIGAARRRCLSAHPFRGKITCLELPETGAFNQAAWPLPEISEFGLTISENPEVARIYNSRATELRGSLDRLTQDAANIFTHNPWGEYGHEEHIMVHRIVTSIAELSGTPVWHTNYVSSWSQALMEKYLSNLHAQYYQNDINGITMLEVADCYKNHGAWTWMDGFHWFPQECYFQGPQPLLESADGGWLCPLNFIRVPDRPAAATRVALSFQERLHRRLARSSKYFRASKSRGH